MNSKAATAGDYFLRFAQMNDVLCRGVRRVRRSEPRRSTAGPRSLSLALVGVSEGEGGGIFLDIWTVCG